MSSENFWKFLKRRLLWSKVKIIWTNTKALLRMAVSGKARWRSNASVVLIKKLVNWLAVQMNWPVSIWGQHWHLMGQLTYPKNLKMFSLNITLPPVSKLRSLTSRSYCIIQIVITVIKHMNTIKNIQINVLTSWCW